MQIDTVNTSVLIQADSTQQAIPEKNPLMGNVGQSTKHNSAAHIRSEGPTVDQPSLKDVVSQARSGTESQNPQAPRESAQDVITDLLESGYSFGQRFAEKKKQLNATEDTDDAIENSDGEDLDAVGNVANQSQHKTKATEKRGDNRTQH